MAEYLDYEGLSEYTRLIKKYTQPWIAVLEETSTTNSGTCIVSRYYNSTLNNYFELAAKDRNFYAPLILHIRDGANLGNMVTEIRFEMEQQDDCGHLQIITHKIENIDLRFPTEHDSTDATAVYGSFALYRYDSITWYAVGPGYRKQV